MEPLSRPSRMAPGIATIKSTRAWMGATEDLGLDEVAHRVTDSARQIERVRLVVARDRAAVAQALLATGYRQVDAMDLLGGISRTRLGHLLAVRA